MTKYDLGWWLCAFVALIVLPFAGMTLIHLGHGFGAGAIFAGGYCMFPLANMEK